MQIRFAIDQLEGPQPVDVRLMKKKTGENQICDGSQTPPQSLTIGPICFHSDLFYRSS